MYNKKFIILLTFTIFTYITSIVHSQYITQVSKFFINNKNPQYSYIDFIKSSYTSLPLLPFNILINILIISFLSSIIYIMFISLFTKPPNIVDTSLSKNTPVFNSIPGSSNIPSPISIPFKTNNIKNIDFSKLNLENHQQILEKIANKNPKLLKMGLNMLKGGSSSKIYPINDKEENIENSKPISLEKDIESNNNSQESKFSSNGYRDYLKSLSNFSLTYSIFKWFLYVILFNVFYFIIFLILIKLNIINKNKLKEELYVKSIIHYYITGFYLSATIIFFVTITNT